MKILLPYKLFKKFFHIDEIQDKPETVFNRYGKESLEISPRRKAEVRQLIDLFQSNGIELSGKTILDVCGGPGFVCKELNELCERCVVTEFSEQGTNQMKENLNIDSFIFDYNQNRLDEIFENPFDIIMFRSSIIFCKDLENLVDSVNSLVRKGGYVLVETTVPTLGEILGWQHQEYIFPRMYNQKTIEKLFYKHGFIRKFAQREYGVFKEYHSRIRDEFGTKGLLTRLFANLFEYPMFLYYAWLAPKKLALDRSLEHKMLTHIWQFTDNNSEFEPPCSNYQVNSDHQSIHFGLEYNGYHSK